MKLVTKITGSTFVAFLALAMNCTLSAQDNAVQEDTSQETTQETATQETATQETATQETAAQETAAPKTIAESIDPGSFSTLFHAVSSAGLADTLKGDGPFTVFAPNDAAFGTLPLGDVQNLFVPANKELLAAVLKHHVVPGKVMAADVAGLTEAKSLLGETLKIEAKDGVVMINGIKVSSTDIECSNGVIHVIDGVFMPSEEAINKVKADIQAAAEKAAAEANKAAEEANKDDTEAAGGAAGTEGAGSGSRN